MFLTKLAMTFGAAWDPETAESNIRDFLGLVLFLIVAVRVIKLYNDGKKGSAFAEGIIGALIAMFVRYPDVLNAFMEWGKGLLGL